MTRDASADADAARPRQPGVRGRRGGGHGGRGRHRAARHRRPRAAVCTSSRPATCRKSCSRTGDSFPLGEDAVAEAVRAMVSNDRRRPAGPWPSCWPMRRRPFATCGPRTRRRPAAGGSSTPECSPSWASGTWWTNSPPRCRKTPYGMRRSCQGRMARSSICPRRPIRSSSPSGRHVPPRPCRRYWRSWADSDAGTTLSHHRAVALALERIGHRSAAPALAGLLGKPGMSGHAMHGLTPLPDKPMEKRHREGMLREIVLARALYHCGDHGASANGYCAATAVTCGGCSVGTPRPSWPARTDAASGRPAAQSPSLTGLPDRPPEASRGPVS